MQLDAFLRSYEQHVKPLGEVHVLYAASNARHAVAYEQVFVLHPCAVPCLETSFKTNLLELLPDDGNIIFFVDDMIFVRSWTVLEVPGLSLRLGPNLTRNYASADMRQLLPSFQPSVNVGCLSWQWSEGELAWGYPLSLDGHVFDLREIRPLIARTHFVSPNTLESGLQQFQPQFLQGRGTCYCMSRVVNVPWNRVQEDWPNRCGEGNDAETLLAQWEAGQQIDLSGLYGVVNQSVHQEFPLVLQPREVCV